MPEGHTIHRVARDQQRLLAGSELVTSSPQGRFAAGAKRLSGRCLERVEALGKHLFYHWAPRGRSRGDNVLHVHLGLYGKFRLHKKRQGGAWPAPRGAVRLRAEGDAAAFDLNGPNRCELISDQACRRQHDRLGPDPLREDSDPERAWRRIHRSTAPIGALLLNQEVIAGVGNIYRSEVLHLLHLHPERRGRDLARSEFDRLWELLVELMRIGVRLNRIVIADPKRLGKPRSRMTRGERLCVYKKTTCAECGGAIAEWTLAARKVFACPQCQD